ncbi:MAG: hypothetical protein AB1757_15550 [Acidobacteriota bacterium]
MSEETRKIIASNLTAAFYNGVERRIAYFGEERRMIPSSPMEDDRVPTLSMKEVFYVYNSFLKMLEEE